MTIATTFQEVSDRISGVRDIAMDDEKAKEFFNQRLAEREAVVAQARADCAKLGHITIKSGKDKDKVCVVCDALIINRSLVIAGETPPVEVITDAPA